MRYLVTARIKPGKHHDLLRAIETGALGAVSVAGDEYLRNMRAARLIDDGRVKWVEVCFCDVPLDEERPFWEEYVDLVRIQDAHARDRCRDQNGTEPWACSNCDCTAKLEAKLAGRGERFVDSLRLAGFARRANERSQGFQSYLLPTTCRFVIGGHSRRVERWGRMP
jgi:hypothetical protein